MAPAESSAAAWRHEEMETRALRHMTTFVYDASQATEQTSEKYDDLRLWNYEDKFSDAEKRL